jgi:hypothetical protein
LGDDNPHLPLGVLGNENITGSDLVGDSNRIIPRLDGDFIGDSMTSLGKDVGLEGDGAIFFDGVRNIET